MRGSRKMFLGSEGGGVQEILMFAEGGILRIPLPTRSAHACISTSHPMTYKMLSKNINGFYVKDKLTL